MINKSVNDSLRLLQEYADKAIYDYNEKRDKFL